jgi:hypothetical protein
VLSAGAALTGASVASPAEGASLAGGLVGVPQATRLKANKQAKAATANDLIAFILILSFFLQFGLQNTVYLKKKRSPLGLNETSRAAPVEFNILRSTYYVKVLQDYFCRLSFSAGICAPLWLYHLKNIEFKIICFRNVP